MVRLLADQLYRSNANVVIMILQGGPHSGKSPHRVDLDHGLQGEVATTDQAMVLRYLSQCGNGALISQRDQRLDACLNYLMYWIFEQGQQVRKSLSSSALAHDTFDGLDAHTTIWI